MASRRRCLIFVEHTRRRAANSRRLAAIRRRIFLSKKRVTFVFLNLNAYKSRVIRQSPRDCYHRGTRDLCMKRIKIVVRNAMFVLVVLRGCKNRREFGRAAKLTIVDRINDGDNAGGKKKNGKKDARQNDDALQNAAFLRLFFLASLVCIEAVALRRALRRAQVPFRDLLD